MKRKVISTIIGVTLAVIVGVMAVLPNDKGIWVSQSEIMSRPTTGAAWNSILSDAAGSWGTASVSNQDSDHDQYVLAGALVCARTGQYCDKTRLALLSAIGTEEGSRWLAVGRNMLGYTIAADVMRNSGNLTGADLTSVSNWLANFLTRTLAGNNSGVQEKLIPFGSGSNASAQEGAVYVSIAAYTGDAEKLEYVWNRFRLYSCDKVGNPEQIIDVNTGFDSGWSFASTYSEACAVNPDGAVKDINPDPAVENNLFIDGAIINDMRRGGNLKFPPGYTSYPWVGLEGYVPAALILQRAGYPAFALKDQAVLRTHEYLCYLKNNTTTDWWEPSRAAEVKHLVKLVYGFDTCDVAYPVGRGRTVGYTDWTHPLGQTVFYVSPSGNDTNSGTQSAPFRTIQKAADIAIGTVYVQAGNYPERITVTRPLAFVAQGIVQMQGFTINAAGVTVDGFVIEASANHDTNGIGVYVNGNDCIIRNNTIRNTARGGIFMQHTTANCQILNNKIAENISQYGINVRGMNHLIEGNEISDVKQYSQYWISPPSYVDADGIRFHGSGHVIRGNNIHDILYSDPENTNPHIDCFQTFDIPPYQPKAENVVIENNICNLPAQAESGLTTSHGVMAQFPVNLTIRNNTFSAAVGIKLENGSGVVSGNNLSGDLSIPASYTSDCMQFTNYTAAVTGNTCTNFSTGAIRIQTSTITGAGNAASNTLILANTEYLFVPASLTNTPSVTASITSTVAQTPSATATNTITPSRTPTVTASATPSRTPTTTPSLTYTPTRTATITMTNTVPPPGSLTCVLVTWTRGLNLRPTESMDNAPYPNMNFGYGANFPVQRIFTDDDGNKWMQINEHIYSAMYLVANGKTYAIPWVCPQG